MECIFWPPGVNELGNLVSYIVARPALEHAGRSRAAVPAGKAGEIFCPRTERPRTTKMDGFEPATPQLQSKLLPPEPGCRL